MVLGQFCSDHLGRLLLLATTAWDEVATNIQNCCQEEQKFKKDVAFFWEVVSTVVKRMFIIITVQKSIREF